MANGCDQLPVGAARLPDCCVANWLAVTPLRITASYDVPHSCRIAGHGVRTVQLAFSDDEADAEMTFRSILD